MYTSNKIKFVLRGPLIRCKCVSSLSFTRYICIFSSTIAHVYFKDILLSCQTSYHGTSVWSTTKKQPKNNAQKQTTKKKNNPTKTKHTKERKALGLAVYENKKEQEEKQKQRHKLRDNRAQHKKTFFSSFCPIHTHTGRARKPRSHATPARHARAHVTGTVLSLS